MSLPQIKPDKQTKRRHPFRAEAVEMYERPIANHVPPLVPHRPWWIVAVACGLLAIALFI